MWIKFNNRMISIKYLLLFIFLFSPTTTNAQEKFSALYGLWQWQETNIQVNVNKCDYNPKKICAIVAKGDKKGNYILRSIQKQDDQYLGKMIHPVNGRSYDAQIQLIDPSRVQITGCAPGKSSCQKSIWKKIQP